MTCPQCTNEFTRSKKEIEEKWHGAQSDLCDECLDKNIRRAQEIAIHKRHSIDPVIHKQAHGDSEQTQV